MSKSYRKPYCSVTVSGDHRGEKDDKQRSNRKIRRTNKTRVTEASRSEDHEPSRPYDSKKSVEVWRFRKDGRLVVDPSWENSKFHFKKIAKGKVRMVK